MFSEKDTEFTAIELACSLMAITIGGFFRRPCSLILVHQPDIIRGYQVRPCPDCDGTGLFLMPDDTKEKCNTCKGKGKLYLNV